MTEPDIPAELRPPAQAALAWINETQQRAFELTGLIDCEQALDADGAGPVLKHRIGVTRATCRHRR